MTNPDVRLLLGQVLTDFGYVITEAHDASAARTAVRLEQFDAILLDVWMLRRRRHHTSQTVERSEYANSGVYAVSPWFD